MAIVIINQHIVEKDLKLKVQQYDKVIPTVLQIPSKDHPYDPSKDHVMQRVSSLMGPRAT
jgi:V-type H+-transporting ATPase subunit F